MNNRVEPIRILFADDHPIVREGLAALLSTQAEMVVIGEAENGEQALEFFRRHIPDVTLMDLRMPVMSGLEATIAIRAEFPHARIIVLTTYDGDEEIYRALQAGARSYLLKDSLRKELLEVIRAVHAGERRIPAAIAQRLAEHPYHSELTARELEVLKLIVKGLANKEIAAALFISEPTVKTHLARVFAKLGVEDRTQAATQALRRGIIHWD